MSLLTLNGLLPPLLITAIALASAFFLVRDTSANDKHEFVSLDGLRGFLALMVFIHHSVFWFNYTHNQGWHGIPSILYDSFGRASIALFFMLSGFLFTYKLLEARHKEIDWMRLFCGRVLRLTPVYLLLVGAMLVIVAIRSNFTQYEDTWQLLANISSWMLFSIPGDPEINSMPGTLQISAGAIWTLPYEWYFYGCLPLLAAVLGSKSKANTGIWLVIGAIFVLTYSWWGLDTKLLWGFVVGGLSAGLVRSPLRSHFSGKNINWVVAAGFIVAYSCFDDGYYYTRLMLLGFCFTCVACGANLFGLLDCRPARALSTISYGIYLLHGVVLYCTFTFVLDKESALALTESQHLLLMFAITPVIIAAASAAWYWIEWPAIRSTSRITAWLNQLYSPRKQQTPPPLPLSVLLDPVEHTPSQQPQHRAGGRHDH